MAEESRLPYDAEQFLESLAARERKESTIKRYRYDLADFYRFLEVTSNTVQKSHSALLTPQQMESYFQLLETGRNYHIRTLKRIQTVLKRYISFLQKSGKLSFNPMSSLDLDESIWNELSDEELLDSSEESMLLHSLKSDAGLSLKQAAARPMLAPRNLFIVSLFLYYGLRLQELSHLCMKDVNQGTGSIDIPENTGNPRTITLSKQDKKLLFHYIQSIPQPVRPYKETDPLFVAFDFQRQTYRWSYENDAPKNLTEIAIQKMIREERKRAGITRSVSARHFRNTYIVRKLHSGMSPEVVMKELGLQTILTLNKYIHYVEEKKHRIQDKTSGS